MKLFKLNMHCVCVQHSMCEIYSVSMSGPTHTLTRRAGYCFPLANSRLDIVKAKPPITVRFWTPFSAHCSIKKGAPAGGQAADSATIILTQQLE